MSGILDLVLVDVIAAWGISIFVERHRGPSNSCKAQSIFVGERKTLLAWTLCLIFQESSLSRVPSPQMGAADPPALVPLKDQKSCPQHDDITCK